MIEVIDRSPLGARRDFASGIAELPRREEEEEMELVLVDAIAEDGRRAEAEVVEVVDVIVAGDDLREDSEVVALRGELDEADRESGAISSS